MVGSGIAGLTAALTASTRARVMVITKAQLSDGSTRWAQGGIAAAVGGDDSAQLHLEDTIAAGRGLCDERAVRVLVDEGPARVRDLRDAGVAFDSRDGELRLGREAAHSRNRVIHSGGDATGWEVENGLVRRLRHAGVTIHEDSAVASLLLDDTGRCAGVEVLAGDGSRRVIGAAAVILATGGAGQLWRTTTNPDTATGDGVALAWDAGAEVASMEFMQFHPTVLAVAGAPHFLLSEAMRGEGAVITDCAGNRFLFDADPRGELAGRDVVSRAIWERLQLTGDDHVLLDCRPLGAAVRRRFPTITRTCADLGIDITNQPIPIAPAAHYQIGGVRTDINGASTVAGLFACGEVASTGVHGANRLASNSLIEGAVFGHRAASSALADIGERPAAPPRVRASSHGAGADGLIADGDVDRLRDAMWQGCGVVRDADGLRETMTTVAEIAASPVTPTALRQAATTAGLVCRAALLREESRGAHTRADFPSTTETWHGVLVMQKERGHRLDRNT